MHPLKQKLKLYIDNKLDSSDVKDIENHLKACEFCNEFLNNYKSFVSSMNKTASEALPQEAIVLSGRLYLNALKGQIIPLDTLITDEKEIRLHLAADGKQKANPRIMNLTTMYSENPEIILRVMHDEEKGEDYLHLISNDPSLSSNVMVQIPELDRQFITDNDGRAVIENVELKKFEQLKWQVKMPDAVFSLEPLVYDPDKTEYASDVVLETDKHDRIKVTFEGKTEGKLISVEIMELDGRDDYGKVKVIVSDDESFMYGEAESHKSISFMLKENQSKINIRLFQ